MLDILWNGHFYDKDGQCKKKMKIRDIASKNIDWIELIVCVVHWLTDVLAVWNDQILPNYYLMQSVQLCYSNQTVPQYI